MAYEKRRRGLDAREDLRQSAADASTRSALAPPRREHQPGTWAAQRLRKIGQKNVLTRETGDLLRAADAAEQRRLDRENLQREREYQRQHQTKQLDRLLRMDEYNMQRLGEQDKYRRERDIVGDKRYKERTAVEQARWDAQQERIKQADARLQQQIEYKRKRDKKADEVARKNREIALYNMGFEEDDVKAYLNQEARRDKASAYRETAEQVQEALPTTGFLGRTALGVAQRGAEAAQDVEKEDRIELRKKEREPGVLEELKVQSLVTPESYQAYRKSGDAKDLVIKPPEVGQPAFPAAQERAIRERLKVETERLMAMEDPAYAEGKMTEGADWWGLRLTPSGLQYKKDLKAQRAKVAELEQFHQMLLSGQAGGVGPQGQPAGAPAGAPRTAIPRGGAPAPAPAPAGAPAGAGAPEGPKYESGVNRVTGMTQEEELDTIRQYEAAREEARAKGDMDAVKDYDRFIQDIQSKMPPLNKKVLYRDPTNETLRKEDEYAVFKAMPAGTVLKDISSDFDKRNASKILKQALDKHDVEFMVKQVLPADKKPFDVMMRDGEWLHDRYGSRLTKYKGQDYSPQVRESIGKLVQLWAKKEGLPENMNLGDKLNLKEQGWNMYHKAFRRWAQKHGVEKNLFNERQFQLELIKQQGPGYYRTIQTWVESKADAMHHDLKEQLESSTAPKTNGE